MLLGKMGGILISGKTQRSNSDNCWCILHPANHKFVNGDVVVFLKGGAALDTNLKANTQYLCAADANTFNICATEQENNRT